MAAVDVKIETGAAGARICGAGGFLGAQHDRNERATWLVVGVTTVMMIGEIVGGSLYNSMALLADGWHMSTHAAALTVAAVAYRYARVHATDPRFAFGTGKVGELAGFASAVVLGVIALLIGWESLGRLLDPHPIHFAQATMIAVLGLVVNLVSAFLLHQGGAEIPGHSHAHDDHDHAVDDHDHGHDDHDHGPAPVAAQVAHDHDHHDHDHDHDHAPAPTHAHDHNHDHAPAAASAHDHDHDHHAKELHASGHHHDNNLRAAYQHVLADALTSVLAIAGLLAGRYLGWVWMDPLIGILGGIVIARWSWSLMKVAGASLLDMSGSSGLAQAVRKRLETGADVVCDMHLWRVGPGHQALIVSIISPQPQSPDAYKARLASLPGLSHVTVEVNPPA